MMQRRYLTALFVACLVLGLVKLFAGGSPLTNHKTQISFWNGWTGPDGTAMLEVIRDFNNANPDVEVSMQRMDWATYYNKLMVSTMSARGPQVFVIHASTLPRMVRAGFLDEVSDLYGPKTGISRSDFEPKVLNQVQFGTRTVALPLDIHPQGMYSNSKLLIAAGFCNPDGTPRPPKTGDEFLKAIRATQKIGPNGQHDVWGFSWTYWRNNFFCLQPQFGGRCFDEKGNPDLANKGNIATLDYMGNMMNNLKLTPEPESNMGFVGFQQNHVAMIFEGVYMVGGLETMKDLKYVGAPLPQIGPQKGTLGDSHCLCVRTGLSPKEREASERFIKYLSDRSLAWAKAGQVPARLSVRNTPEFKQLQVQYAFSQEVPYVAYLPKTPLLFELETEIDLAVEKVLRGRATSKDALEAANANLIAAVKRDQEENKS